MVIPFGYRFEVDPEIQSRISGELELHYCKSSASEQFDNP